MDLGVITPGRYVLQNRSYIFTPEEREILATDNGSQAERLTLLQGFNRV